MIHQIKFDFEIYTKTYLRIDETEDELIGNQLNK